MSKFGDLIEAQVPVLISFFSNGDEISEAMNPMLRKLASEMGDSARVIKINIDKNQELVKALRIKEVPTLMIYKDGEMKWRQSGELDSGTLSELLKEFI